MNDALTPFGTLSHVSQQRTLVVHLDADLNIVARVLDLLIVLDLAIPDLSLVSERGETRLVLSGLGIAPASRDVLMRRIEQTTGVRAVEASER